MKASITLESSIIYPMIIFISMMLILYTFFIHDKLSIKSNAYRVLMEDYSSNSISSLSSIEESLNEKCLLSYTYNINYESDKNTISITSHPNTFPSFSTNLSFTNYERCSFIRQYYALFQLLHSRKD